MADDRITDREFHDSDGVEDWRVLLATAQTPVSYTHLTLPTTERV